MGYNLIISPIIFFSIGRTFILITIELVKIFHYLYYTIESVYSFSINYGYTLFEINVNLKQSLACIFVCS